MSEMEPEVSRFLRRIVWTFFLSFIWMSVNSFIGIKLGYFFIENGIITYKHALCYLFLIVSFIFLFRYLRNSWRQQEKWSGREND
jgi:hypothetical protein